MAGPQKKVILYILEGTRQKFRLDNDNYLIVYETVPDLPSTNDETLDDIVGKFIEQAGELAWGAPLEARKLWERQCVEAGEFLFNWLVEGFEALKLVLTNLTADDRLIIYCDDRVMSLPWEMLYAGERFIARDCPLIRRPMKTAADAVLPRSLTTASDKARPSGRLGLPLRVLGFSYSTPGKSVDPDDHWTGVEESLEALVDRRLVDFRLLDEDELFEFLVNTTLPEDVDEVDILHILAHGTAPDTDTLEFEGDATIDLESKSFSGSQLADIVLGRLNQSSENRKLPLVLLASCKSGRQNKSGLIQPVSEAMLRKGVPAVVAMQYDISLDAAKVFMAGIYRGLAEGKPLDEAIQDGRRATGLINDTIEWATPVVYSHLDDLALLALLSRSDQQIRQRYLAALRAATPEIKAFFPIQVVEIESDDAPDAPTAAGSDTHRPGALQAGERTAAQRRLDAESIFQDEKKNIPNRVSILLGDAGGGKSAILDKFLCDLIPASEEGEFSAELRQYAYHPASYFPIRLSFQKVGTEEFNYRLRSLLRQGMARLWSMQPDQDQALPTEEQINAWVDAGWTFLVILEDFEAVPDAEREQVSLHLFNLIQRNPQHYFIFTGTVDSFDKFAGNLGQFPQWQTVALSPQHIRKYIDEQNLLVDDEGLLDLVRQPWAFGTFKELVNQGQVAFSQASLLQGRIDNQLNRLSDIRERYLAGRVRQSLIQMARRMKASGQSELAVNELFQVMKEIRGERTYDLEALFAALTREGILTAREQDGTEMVRFQESYIFSILYALAMTDAVRQMPDFIAGYDLAPPDARLSLVLMAQLDDRNMEHIVLGLMKRLGQAENSWEERLDLLDLVVNCARPKFWQLEESLRVKIIQELCCCILPEDQEALLKDWLAAQPFEAVTAPLKEINLNGRRISSAELRTHVLSLLAATKTPHAFEVLRWFVMESLQAAQPGADGKMRQKALQLLREVGQWAAFKEAALQKKAQAREAAEAPDAPSEAPSSQELFERQTAESWHAFLQQAPVQPLAELLATWNQVRQQDSTAVLSGFDRLKEWLLAGGEPWRSSITAVTLADIGARQPAWTEPATNLLVEQFLNSKNEHTIDIISESFTLLSYLPPDNDSGRRIKEKMLAIAGRPRSKSLDKTDWQRQYTAVGTIGRLKMKESLSTLVTLLNNPTQDFRVRARAAWAIGRICAEYPQHPDLNLARSGLMEAAKNLYDWPQHEAIKALGLCYPDYESKLLLYEIRENIKEGSSQSTTADYTVSLIDQTIKKCDVNVKTDY